jgi:hypothetical protein
MTVGSLYGVAMLLIGVGLVIAGLVIARRRMLTGWARWITLGHGRLRVRDLVPGRFRAECGRTAGNRWLDARLGGLGWAVARPEQERLISSLVRITAHVISSAPTRKSRSAPVSACCTWSI